MLRAAKDPSIVRWYQEDQVLNVVPSDPLKINAVYEISLDVTGELAWTRLIGSLWSTRIAASLTGA